MVLVDSSIWIKYFNSEEFSGLTELLVDNLVVTNEVILTEIVPFLEHHKSFEAANSIMSIEKIDLDIDWVGLKQLQKLNLKNGVNKVGIPDLIIAQQAIQNKVFLWSNDKHFQFMSKYMNFDLFV